MIYGMKPWEDAKADAAIALYRAQADATRYSTCTRILEEPVIDVDAILSVKAALDNASEPIGYRWRYFAGSLEEIYVNPRDFYRSPNIN